MGLHQIIRIPIAGPKPFNTLIYMEAILDDQSEGVGTPASVDLSIMARGTVVIASPLVLKGWDPSNSPVQVPHSSTAWISGIGPQAHCDFQYSVDSVRAAGFDPTFSNPPFPDLNMDQSAKLKLKELPFDGTFYFAIDIAYRLSSGTPENCMEYAQAGTDQSGQPIMACVGWSVPDVIKVSSYVLVWEPEPPKGPVGWGSSQNFRNQAALSVLEDSKRKGQRRRGGPTIVKLPPYLERRSALRLPGKERKSSEGKFGCR